MRGYIGLGAFGLYLMIHIIALTISAAYAPLLGVQVPLECIGIPSFACGSPFENMAIALNGEGVGFLDLPILAANALPMLIGLLIIDYDIFKGGGEVAGAVGLLIRGFGWAMIAGAIVALGIQFFGR